MGIITLGDFRRNQLTGDKIINTRFTKIDVCNETKAVEKLNEKWNINAIPIVDEDNKIVKEYYKCIENCVEEAASFETIKWICKETLIMKDNYCYDKILFVTENLTKENKKEAEFIHNETNGKIVITDRITIGEIGILAEEYTIAVCDFDIRVHDVRSIIYDRWKIDNILWDTNSIKLKRILCDRVKLFDNVGILSEEKKYFENLLNNHNTKCDLDITNCVWNKDKQCYEYVGEVEEDIESVLMLVCFLEHPYMIIGDRYIPIISLKFIKNVQAEHELVNIDVAFNIIPKLQKNNIDYIVIKNPDIEYEEIKEFLGEDIRNRVFLWSKIEELERFINKNEKIDIQIVEELRLGMVPFIKNGFQQGSDMYGKYINSINGERYTCNNPREFNNVMYLFGPCIVRGTLVEDQYTIGSFLKTLVDDSYYIKNCGYSWQSMNYAIRNNKYKQGDIVIIFVEDFALFEMNGIKTYSIIDAYKKVPNLHNHVWDTLTHCNKVVTEYIAEEIYNICEKEGVLKNSSDYGKPKKVEKIVEFGQKKKRIEIPEQLKQWLSEVKEHKIESNGKAGAIVMNCNPFTLGHRYLIEESKKQVDVLYIFVVQENKSFFDFVDRLKMVKLGVADMKNVVVIPSGKYIISTETLPGYFNKEEQPYVQFDATDDLELFAEVIAKEFDIKVRFAGEEPKDPFTRKYNEFMRNILPQHGVEFYEIPRKELEGEVISASLVRKNLKEQEYEKVKKMVLPSIYDYLMEHYCDKK
ncbi:MAG: adenylyltransferase/cytidyltransferase family protein [Lachnospiraceae bacterium]|nr:adenylyltransferase/cytidyltransferase family protein [Lachnospiraceae bacterium]